MLEIKHVTKEFLGYKGIRDISVTFQPGQICAVLGRNGSGKTTLLHCILGLIDPDQGIIDYEGKAVYDQYDKVAFVSADGSSLPYMRVKEYGKFLQRYYPSFSMEDYEKYMNDFELAGIDKISSLSKGQKMKVELAAAFAQNASLILLDEPFSALDIYAREDVIKRLLEMVMKERILLVSTHDITEIEGIADRCIILEQGRLCADFTMDELYEQGEDLKTRLERLRLDQHEK